MKQGHLHIDRVDNRGTNSVKLLSIQPLACSDKSYLTSHLSSLVLLLPPYSDCAIWGSLLLPPSRQSTNYTWGNTFNENMLNMRKEKPNEKTLNFCSAASSKCHRRFDEIATVQLSQPLVKVIPIVWVIHKLCKLCQVGKQVFSKVEKILKGSLDLMPSPSTSVEIRIIGGKVCLKCRGKTLLEVVNKLKFIHPAMLPSVNFLANSLAEGDGIKSRLSS